MSKSSDAYDQIDPSVVFFTFSRIRPQFSCGRSVEETLESCLRGETTPADLPTITVLFDGEHFYSLNNRRLFVLKELKKRGVIGDVTVRVRGMPTSRRMKEKYTPSKCSLNATLMRESIREHGTFKPTDGAEDVEGEGETVESLSSHGEKRNKENFGDRSATSIELKPIAAHSAKGRDKRRQRRGRVLPQSEEAPRPEEAEGSDGEECEAPSQPTNSFAALMRSSRRR